MSFSTPGGSTSPTLHQFMNQNMGNETDLMNELSLGGDIGLEDSPPLVTKTIEPGSSSGHRTKQEPEQYSGPLKKKRPMNSRISLFANPSPDRRGEESDEDDAHDHTFRASEHEDESAQTSAGEHQESKRADAKDRDQRLKETLWELRKMVEVFEGFEQGIRESREGNQRLAERTRQTSSLLDSYILLLSQTEHTQKLVMNQRWKGISDDLQHMEEQTRLARIRLEEEEARRLEAERARKQSAEEEEERKRLDAEAQERASSTRGRGTSRLGLGSTRGSVRGRVGVAGSTRGRVVSGSRPNTTGTGSSGAGTTGGIRKPSTTLARRNV